jgi:hypothetical protein
MSINMEAARAVAAATKSNRTQSAKGNTVSTLPSESLVLSSESARTLNTISQLENRNRIARDTIKKYADRHAAMDIAIGAAGFFGFAVPALIAAIAAQSPIIYQPLARELEQVYNASAYEETRAIIRENVVVGGLADIAGEFSTEFVASIATELLTEAGLGTAASFIPFVGGLIGAALDYVIATAMTWRVGTMVSIYYQNGGKWVGSRKHTFELAKDITGGIEFGLSDLVSRFSSASRPTMDVDLNDISRHIPEVFETQVRNIKTIIPILMQMGGTEQVRQALISRGVPVPVIDAALRYMTAAASR